MAHVGVFSLTASILAPRRSIARRCAGGDVLVFHLPGDRHRVDGRRRRRLGGHDISTASRQPSTTAKA
jgi:hypothetical protein